MASAKPIRHILLTEYVLVIILLGGGVLLAMTWAARTMTRGLSGELIDKTTDLTRAEVERFFDAVSGALLTARSWGMSELLDTEDPSQLIRLVGPLIDRHDHVSVMMIADSSGRGTTVQRDDDGWTVTQEVPGQWGDRARVWKGKPHTGGDTEYRESGGDVRGDDWFARAVEVRDAFDASPSYFEKNRVHWTDPYTLHEIGEPGMTASIAHRTADGRDFVIAFDVSLFDISQFTITLHPSPNGIAFLLDSESRVIGLPCGGGFEDPEACRASMLSTPNQLGMPVLVDGAAAHARSTGDVEHLRFASGGETWWAGGETIEVGDRHSFLAVVVVPESDLLGDLTRLRYIVIAIMAVVLILALRRALVASRRISGPVESLVASSDRIARLQLDATQDIDTRVSEVARLAEAQSRMRSALREFTRYMPTDLVRELVHMGQQATVGGRAESLTVLFTDIVGFTTTAERMDPQDLSDHLAEYFYDVMKTLSVHRGTIDKTMGDAVMAFWGAPRPDSFHATNAVNAVLACAERVDELNAKWEGEGRAKLPTCFGLATGRVMVGNVGSPTRLSYTAIGDTVNVASRLQGLTRTYGVTIIADANVREATGEAFEWRRIDRVAVRNRREEIDIYEPLGRVGEVDEDRIASARAYETAWEHSVAGRYAEAIDALEPWLDRDPCARWLREQCKIY